MEVPVDPWPPVRHEEDNSMVYEEMRMTILKATVAILSLSLALASLCLTGWWA
jgi:hypothetical protein